MANPRFIRWQHDGVNTDGSLFDAEQFQQWELEVNGEVALSVPAGWDGPGGYEVPIADFNAFRETGAYTIRMRLVNKNGVASEWSAPATFSMDFREPAAPFGLSVG